MEGLWSTGLILLVLGWLSLKAWRWRSNYNQAVSSGLPVFLSPINIHDIWWQFLRKLLTPILQCLPQSWTFPWLQMSQPTMIWKYGYYPHDIIGSDSFVFATPSGNILWTCDLSIMNQILTQPDKCQKSKDMAPGLNKWGPNVVSTEGDEWKQHRKMISTGLGSSINPIVWAESQHQMVSLIDVWLESGIKDVKPWMSRLALHVISGGFFGKRVAWEESLDSAPPGHQLSFEKALFTVIDKFALIYLTPRIILEKFPLRAFREAYLGLAESDLYMQELQAGVLAHLDEVEAKKKKSLLEIIVMTGISEKSKGGGPVMSQDSVRANIFMSLVAGHETTGNVLAFIMILLAIYPDYQQQMQDELDRQLGDRPREEWTVQNDYAILQNGLTGGVQKEALHLYHPGRFLKRKTIAPMTISDSKGVSTYHLPKNTALMINLAAASKHPAVWTKRTISPERRAELHHSPALDFDPFRWIEDDTKTVEQQEAFKRLWAPFGQGPRYCPGKAFAQVEMTAVMATLFKEYSIELVVDEATLQKCNGDAKMAWEKTRDQAIRMVYDDVATGVTIYMGKELPLRIVPRSTTP